MSRQLSSSTIVIASHNNGKVSEIKDLLKPYAVTIKSASELDLIEPEETENTYKGNALLKAREAALASNLPALADDSGFELNAIDNQPGVNSARWAGEDRDFARAMENLFVGLQLSGSKDLGCRFVCALSIVWPDGHDETVEASVEGNFVWPPRGENGFGYDPVFQPNGHQQTFGEMEASIKNGLSHRNKAFALLIKRCFDKTTKAH